MKDQIKLVWECTICNDIITSYSEIRHQMNYCKCGKSAVDLEEHYQRNAGSVKELTRFKKEWVEIR